MQNCTEIVLVEPLYRGVGKYSDFGCVKGYISEAVQDTALDAVND